MIKQAILIGGVVFYAFIISSLIGGIREENFTKSFLRIIDSNMDGIITSKQMKQFTPCSGFDGKRLQKQFKYYPRKADLNQISQALNPKIVMASVDKCIGNLQTATNPQHLQKLNKAQLQRQLLKAYDLNQDNRVQWAQFNIFNQKLKKQPKNLRQIFRFFDKNHNWVIEHKQLQTSKPKNLLDFLGSGKRK